ncbi:amidohydrolase [Coprinopsis cinerea okayama7|uniref:Amidohydrolase n=1 Tax=Coprinopsis cinerea (strain Okayama-7 / 130 / ATCC MYA-4618 / FGSC 9003) TaxID=240176 RepID=A8N6L3_COPC7|nr:amidohydrolase [Coprinopsis cinerea okayama7\|eukprot:XP_001830469.2 amidohydrolase [Coprinopsis cinerea okayama7\
MAPASRKVAPTAEQSAASNGGDTRQNGRKAVATANGKGHRNRVDPNDTAGGERAGLSLGISIAVLGFLGLAASLAASPSQKHVGLAQPGTYAVCSAGGPSIYTVDNDNSRVACISIAKNRIQAVGSLGQSIRLLGHVTKFSSAVPLKGHIRFKWYTSSFITNLLQGSPQFHLPVHYIPPGAIVIPGISDSHAHILEFGATQQLPLEGTKSVEETVARVRNFEALENDPILRGRPIILQSKDCHALWVSSAALKPSLPLPDEVEGGVIVRDQNNQPTGVLLDNAQDLLKQPKLTQEDLLRRFKVTVREAHKHGLTSIHDAGLDPISLEFFHSQAEKAPLPIRIYGMKYFNETVGYSPGSYPIDLPEKRLSIRSMKIFADGALRTGGAALYEPYADNPSTSGFMRIEKSLLYDVIPKFLSNGWQVNVHAIGDKANGIILDVFESALKGINVTALRPRLEHAQMMTKEDMVRLGKLGVIASVQPTHAISDMWYAEDRLGPVRVKQLYAFRSIIDSGARITLGSDFPVEAINPLSGFYAAITRLSLEGTSPHGPQGWFPEERLTREEALRGMTIDPAYASFTESELGSLEVGKLADFVVLSADIMSIPENEIMATKVLATAIDGDVVYGKL